MAPIDKNKFRNVSAVLYLIMLTIMISTSIYLSSHGPKLKEPDRITPVFYDSHGNKIRENNLIIEKEGDIYFNIPKNFEDKSLCLRSKHVVFDVYINNNLIYKQILDKNNLYTFSNGATWTLVPLGTYKESDEVRIHYTACYNENKCTIDNIYLESEWNYVREILSKKAMTIITGFTLFILSIICMIIQIPISVFIKKGRDFFYLGIMSLAIAVYILAESQVVQLFIANNQLMHVISYYALSLVPISAIAYAGEFYNIHRNWIKNILIALSFMAFIIVFILNVFNVCDYHESAVLLHLALSSSILYILLCLINYVRHSKNKTKKSNVIATLQFLGLGSLCICAFIDVLRFYLLIVEDQVLFTRSAVVLFIGFYLLSSAYKIAEFAQVAMTTDVISSLAYKDGLTGLGNRTAYEEALRDLDKTPFGLVMMDLNDLKKVNDLYGHKKGDELLLKASESISRAFETVPMCTDIYRIGGDEFVGICLTKDIFEFDSYIKEVYKVMPFINKEDSENELEISVAMGWYFYDPFQLDSSINHTIMCADKQMYSCKKKMKVTRFNTEIKGVENE